MSKLAIAAQREMLTTRVGQLRRLAFDAWMERQTLEVQTPFSPVEEKQKAEMLQSLANSEANRTAAADRLQAILSELPEESTEEKRTHELPA